MMPNLVTSAAKFNSLTLQKKKKKERKKTVRKWLNVTIFTPVVIHKNCYMCLSLNQQAIVASFYKILPRKITNPVLDGGNSFGAASCKSNREIGSICCSLHILPWSELALVRTIGKSQTNMWWMRWLWPRPNPLSYCRTALVELTESSGLPHNCLKRQKKKKEKSVATHWPLQPAWGAKSFDRSLTARFALLPP